MPVIKGILSFPNVFTAKVAKGASDPKFTCALLIPADDPQLQTLKAEVEAAKVSAFPSGYTGADECLAPYDTKYAGKDYYDARFSGWWVWSSGAKADDRPAVVDMNRQPVTDPASVYSGMVAYVNAGIGGYTKGKGGIGGWLNGIMVTDEAAPFGRLDGKPTVDQMFANVDGSTSTPSTPSTPPPTPPTPPPAPNAGLVMTPAANGATYEQFKAQGWSDQQMIDGGMAIAPSFA